MGHWPRRVALVSLVVLALGLFTYYAVTGWQTYRDLTAARDQLQATQDSTPGAAQQPVLTATSYANSAARRMDSPLWAALAAVPVLGDTAQAARQVTSALDRTLQAVQPLVTDLDLLRPGALVQDGRIDLSALEQAIPEAQQALPELATAEQELDVGGLVPRQLRAAIGQLRGQVRELRSTLDTVATVGPVAAPLLGSEGKRRYFIGLLNPNEMRGSGGFLGTYAIATTDDGAISISDIGSNTDLPTLTSLPPGLSSGFAKRYRDDPTLIGNMNLSPHFPDTARIWLAAWQQKTGEKLDGAIAVDTVTLGKLVDAAGTPVTLPDGINLTGSQLADFANIEIYKKFPAEQAAERKAYQEAATSVALDTVAALPAPVPMARAIGDAFAKHRIVVWTSELLDSGSIKVPDGHFVQPVVLNTSGSKLDAYLVRETEYRVGRCGPSTVIVSLRSDIPLGERPPPYMVGSARRTATGPVNSVILQLHMPNGAKLRDVRLNGKRTSAFRFRQAGRPAALVGVDLPPRKRQEIRFTFTEPPADGPGEVTVQPLFRDEVPVVVDEPC